MTANRSNPDSAHHSGTTLADVAVLDTWGKYAPAVERWAEIVGRPAPPPTDSQGRLSSEFVEWMMGYDEGWVSDPELNISRTGQLRCLGNAIVPMQAAAAWSHLLGMGVAQAGRQAGNFYRLHGPATRTAPVVMERAAQTSGRS